MTDLYVKGRSIAWAVYRKDVGRVSTFSYSQRDAIAKMDAMNKASKIKIRNCLTCSSKFESEGAHNRMCKSCRMTSHDPMMINPQFAS